MIIYFNTNQSSVYNLDIRQLFKISILHFIYRYINLIIISKLNIKFFINFTLLFQIKARIKANYIINL